MFNYKILILSILITFLATGTVIASGFHDTDKQGRKLASLIDQRDEGYGDSIAKMTMTIINRGGISTVRKLQVKLLEVVNGGDKSLMRFDFPADIRGTTLLTHPKFDRDDEQWLYLPSVNRVKRISSRNKSGSFVGSEFSFEDLSDKNIDDFTYQYLGESACEFNVVAGDTEAVETIKARCDRLARMPVDKHSGYSKQVLLIEKQDQRILTIDYYDRKGILLKNMESKIFRLFDDKYWRPLRIEMLNKQSGKSTILEYKTLTFGNNLNVSDFNRSTLSR